MAQMPINQSHELHGAYQAHRRPARLEVVHGAAHGGAGFYTLLDSSLDGDTDHDVENLTGSPYGGDLLIGNALPNVITASLSPVMRVPATDAFRAMPSWTPVSSKRL